ncbi:MAG TPA: nuclear transport factor 2 family protein [Chloroflexota bacterium]|jgi:ketosteroid isomerase-like protein
MTQTSASEAQLRELDITIDIAVSARDAATLERLLADDFVYTHAGGKPEPKREFIATAVARLDPPRRVLHDIQVERHGDVAVTRGTIEFIYSDRRPNLYLGYVRVHRVLDGGWRPISHRSFHASEPRPST